MITTAPPSAHGVKVSRKLRLVLVPSPRHNLQLHHQQPTAQAHPTSDKVKQYTVSAHTMNTEVCEVSEHIMHIEVYTVSEHIMSSEVL